MMKGAVFYVYYKIIIHKNIWLVVKLSATGATRRVILGDITFPRW